MSQQAGDCLAEVEIETLTGKYRVTWTQRRARSKADGNLQPHKHEIADLVTGKILASGVRYVTEAVAEKTGMNYEQFSRSILLSQGEFAAFLKAESDDRSRILEYITGAEIYSRISRYLPACPHSPR